MHIYKKDLYITENDTYKELSNKLIKSIYLEVLQNEYFSNDLKLNLDKVFNDSKIQKIYKNENLKRFDFNNTEYVCDNSIYKDCYDYTNVLRESISSFEVDYKLDEAVKNLKECYFFKVDKDTLLNIYTQEVLQFIENIINYQISISCHSRNNKNRYFDQLTDERFQIETMILLTNIFETRSDIVKSLSKEELALLKKETKESKSLFTKKDKKLLQSKLEFEADKNIAEIYSKEDLRIIEKHSFIAEANLYDFINCNKILLNRIYYLIKDITFYLSYMTYNSNNRNYKQVKEIRNEYLLNIDEILQPILESLIKCLNKESDFKLDNTFKSFVENSLKRHLNFQLENVNIETTELFNTVLN